MIYTEQNQYIDKFLPRVYVVADTCSMSAALHTSLVHMQWQQGRGYKEEKTRVKILQGDKVETMD
jgi:hypothetical protein